MLVTKAAPTHLTPATTTNANRLTRPPITTTNPPMTRPMAEVDAMGHHIINMPKPVNKASSLSTRLTHLHLPLHQPARCNRSPVATTEVAADPSEGTNLARAEERTGETTSRARTGTRLLRPTVAEAFPRWMTPPPHGRRALQPPGRKMASLPMASPTRSGLQKTCGSKTCPLQKSRLRRTCLHQPEHHPQARLPRIRRRRSSVSR